MRQVSILKSTVDLDRLEIRDRLVTAFLVGPNGLEDIAIEEEPVPRTVALPDPETGEAVTLEGDPLRWADLLPGAFRSGDYRVTVDVVHELDAGAPVLGSDTQEMPALVEL